MRAPPTVPTGGARESYHSAALSKGSGLHAEIHLLQPPVAIGDPGYERERDGFTVAYPNCESRILERCSSRHPRPRRSVRAPRNPTHDRSCPDCTPRPVAAPSRGSACPRPTAFLTRSHHCRLHPIASPPTSSAQRLRSHRKRTRQRPYCPNRTTTPPSTQITRLFVLFFHVQPPDIGQREHRAREIGGSGAVRRPGAPGVG